MPTTITRCFAHHGIERDDLRDEIARFKAFYREGGHGESAVYPGVREAVERLRDRGLRLGICTNKDEAPARDLVAAKGLDDLFDVLVGGDSTPARKPDPTPLIRCAELLGLEMAEIAYVGDSAVDAETAKTAHMPFVLHLHGYRLAPLDALVFDAPLNDYADLDDALDQAWRSRRDHAA